jgi:hypothetical protein
MVRNMQVADNSYEARSYVQAIRNSMANPNTAMATAIKPMTVELLALLSGMRWPAGAPRAAYTVNGRRSFN